MTEIVQPANTQPETQPGTPVGQAERRSRSWGTIALYAVLTVVVLLYSLPGLGVLLTSFKTTEEIARDGLWSLPDALRFTNYVEAWVGGNVLVYARNSLLVTIPATIVSISCGISDGLRL